MQFIVNRCATLNETRSTILQMILNFSANFTGYFIFSKNNFMIRLLGIWKPFLQLLLAINFERSKDKIALSEVKITYPATSLCEKYKPWAIQLHTAFEHISSTLSGFAKAKWMEECITKTASMRSVFRLRNSRRKIFWIRTDVLHSRVRQSIN